MRAIEETLPGLAATTEETVTLVRGAGGGAAFFAPPTAAWKRLGTLQREALADLQNHVESMRQMQLHLDDLVEELREGGVSWSLIGFSTGLTSEGARQRWGV